jgi:two-component system chemotaxis sensor kinase CheA
LERLLQGLLEANAKVHQPEKSPDKGQKERTGSDVFFFEAEPLSNPAGPELQSKGLRPLKIQPDDLDMFKDFTQETPDLLASIESNLLNLSRERAWDVMGVYRPFHTLKGLFGFMGLTTMNETAHRAENLLEPFKKGQGRPTAAQVEVLLKVLDLFRRQTELIGKGIALGEIEICPIPELGESPSSNPQQDKNAGSLKISEERTDAATSEDTVLKVNISRLDRLMEAVEDMTVSRSRLLTLAQTREDDPDLKEEVDRLAKLTRTLQDQVLSLRMVTVEPLFKRLSRLVRDLSQKTRKTVQLHLEGSSTELDKRLVDELWEPVVHLIRNAMDHGLEAPAERVQASKPPHGTLKVRAALVGGDFVLEVVDDGRGLSLAKLEEKALQMGWLAPDVEPDPHWLEDLIFRPGFSTAQKVSDVSGRGVGLDVVRRRVQELKGVLKVENWEGQGCRFILRLPQTLALMEGVLLRAGRGFYLLPLTQVGNFKKLPPSIPQDDMGPAHIDLSKTFGEDHDPNRQPVGIQVGFRGREAFLMADEILGRRQVILRPLPGLMEDFPALSGTALLGDGRVGLVLDVPSLLGGPLTGRVPPGGGPP